MHPTSKSRVRTTRLPCLLPIPAFQAIIVSRSRRREGPLRHGFQRQPPAVSAFSGNSRQNRFEAQRGCFGSRALERCEFALCHPLTFERVADGVRETASGLARGRWLIPDETRHSNAGEIATGF